MHMGVPVRFICIGFDLRPIRRASRRTKDDLSTVVCLNEARMKSSCKSIMFLLRVSGNLVVQSARTRRHWACTLARGASIVLEFNLVSPTSWLYICMCGLMQADCMFARPSPIGKGKDAVIRQHATILHCVNNRLIANALQLGNYYYSVITSLAGIKLYAATNWTQKLKLIRKDDNSFIL